jgi:hypothetical protein
MNKDMIFGLKIIALFVIAALGVRWYLDWRDKQATSASAATAPDSFSARTGWFSN